MTYNEITTYLKLGKVGMLPHYEGYFYWDPFYNIPYMKNKDYKTTKLDEEKQRNDWFYII